MRQINLNEKQKEAVEFNKGDLPIIAGAGTGKTSVITERIIHIINSGWAKPSEDIGFNIYRKSCSRDANKDR